ncbi:MAG: TonB-dependent receptor [Candidatus Kapaibacterium sp.]
MIRIILLCITILFTAEYYAMSASDSIKVYTLGDISVTGAFSKGKIAQTNINTVSQMTLQKSDVRSASELQLYIPSGKIRTNSRGESMLFLRGAGERQLGLFFDGVPLNVAWDNRFDLSMLPVDIIGKIDVNKNANSVMFGANVLGGAVNISTFERASDGFGGTARFQTGEAGLIQASAGQEGRIGGFNYIASASYIKQDGYTISGSKPDSLLNQDLSSDLRDNSDREFLSFYGRTEYEFSENSKIGISLLHINGNKGVGAETHLPESDARLWRFPDWNRTIISSNGEFNLLADKSLSLRSTVWFDIFNQRTDSYSDISFSEITGTQKDIDQTGGARLALNWSLSNYHSFTYALNWYNTHHSEKVDDSPESLFAQNVISNGISYNYTGDLLNIRAGIVYDNILLGDAGNFIEAVGSTMGDYGAFAGIKYLLDEKTVLFANLSRRTRFPTMREAYSGALNRFKVNPDLKPETGILTELGLSREYDNFRIELAAFANFYDDLIEQVTLPRDDDGFVRRMRINMSKASIFGADFASRWRLFDRLYMELNFTYMTTEAEQDGNKVDYIDNRPEFLLGWAVNYSFNFGLNLLAELEGTGKQFERSPDDQTKFVEIGATTVLNFRVGYQLPYLFKTTGEVFVRANNILDTYRLSQLGLPEPGRMITAGINLNF